ncbi:MAG: hypothetical protein WCI20_08030 [bacterium]
MNIAQVLKVEISRISKREAKLLTSTTRSTAIILKKTVADLKARLATLEKSNRELQKQVATLIASQPAPVGVPEEGRAWISGKGVKTLRRKTGLTQAEFGKLTGVTAGAVRLWESRAGMLKLRDATKKAIMAVRGIGKAEARKRLAELAPVKGKVKGKRSGLKGRK